MGIFYRLSSQNLVNIQPKVDESVSSQSLETVVLVIITGITGLLLESV